MTVLWVRLVFLGLILAFAWTFVGDDIRDALDHRALKRQWAQFRRLTPREKLTLVGPWLVMAILALAGAGAIFDVGGGPRPFQAHRDEVEYGLSCYALTLLLAAAFPRVSVLLIAGAIIALGGAIEVTQGVGMVQGSMQLRDWAADIVGAVAAAAPIVLFSRVWRPEEAHPPGRRLYRRVRRPLSIKVWMARAAVIPVCLYGLWSLMNPDHTPPFPSRWDWLEKVLFWFAFLQGLMVCFPRTRPVELAGWLLAFGALIEVLQALKLFQGDLSAGDWIAELAGVALSLAPLTAGRFRAASRALGPRSAAHGRPETAAT